MSTVSLGSPLRAIVRLSLYFGLTVLLLPVQAIAVYFALPLRTALPLWYHRQCCRILGVQVERRGRRSRVHPTLYVSNHISYLDISVLGSLIPGSFVAKAEVRNWALLGWCARLQRSVFVDRRAARVAEESDEISRRLAAGDDLILFAEGTSGDGNRVLPFKSALLSVIEQRRPGESSVIQPVSIAYTRLDGLPLGRNLRPYYAWYGDMLFAPHIWQLAGLGRLTVQVHFHSPVSSADFGSRKELCDYCYERAAEGLAEALADRPQRPSGPPPVALA